MSATGISTLLPRCVCGHSMGEHQQKTGQCYHSERMLLAPSETFPAGAMANTVCGCVQFIEREAAR